MNSEIDARHVLPALRIPTLILHRVGDTRGSRSTRVDSHDGIVREQLARFRGREIKSLGDGFLATFDGPARGVRCATAISDLV